MTRKPSPEQAGGAVPAPAPPPRGRGAEQASRLPGASGGQEQELEVTVERMNELVQALRRELQFSVDEESGDTVITVINAETQEVVRQIPPKEALQLAQALSEGGAGLTRGLKA